jgi:hypothetical protein
MARRLAHEIKTPLTPIQLAVEEIHERYQDSDPSSRRPTWTTRIPCLWSSSRNW